MVAEGMAVCQPTCYIIDMSFEREALVRTRLAEVEGMEGVGGVFNSLIGLWKFVEKFDLMRNMTSEPSGRGQSVSRKAWTARQNLSNEGQLARAWDRSNLEENAGWSTVSE